MQFIVNKMSLNIMFRGERGGGGRSFCARDGLPVFVSTQKKVPCRYTI